MQSVESALAHKIGLLVVENEKLAFMLKQARAEVEHERQLRMKAAEGAAALEEPPTMVIDLDKLRAS